MSPMVEGPRDWTATTIEQFIEVVDSYIRWYNEKRIKIPLGFPSPIEYRQSLGLATQNQSKFLSAPPCDGEHLARPCSMPPTREVLHQRGGANAWQRRIRRAGNRWAASSTSSAWAGRYPPAASRTKRRTTLETRRK